MTIYTNPVDVSVYLLFFFCVYTYLLWKDTPLFRFAQTSAWAVMIGSRAALALDTINKIAVTPIGAGDYLLIIPLLLGLMLFMRFVKPVGYLRRIPIAFQVGVILGIAVQDAITVGIGTNLKYFVNLPFIGGKYSPVDNTILWVLALCVLTYFINLRGNKGFGAITSSQAFGTIVKVGRYAIMIGLGAGLATTIQSNGAWLVGVIKDVLMKLSIISV